jgi:hypothetical protein
MSILIIMVRLRLMRESRKTNQPHPKKCKPPKPSPKRSARNRTPGFNITSTLIRRRPRKARAGESLRDSILSPYQARRRALLLLVMIFLFQIIMSGVRMRRLNSTSGMKATCAGLSLIIKRNSHFVGGICGFWTAFSSSP